MARVVFLTCFIASCSFLVMPIFAAHAVVRHDDPNGYYLGIPFNEMTSAQKTAARRAAKTQIIQPLLACASPDNMPLSNKKGEGVENQILELLAKKLDTTTSFFWQAGNHRGMMNQVFQYRNCNLLLGVSTGSTRLLETLPIYRTTYVFVTRKGSGIHIKSLDDPALKKHSLGVVEPSAMRQVLAEHGLKTGLDVQYQINRQPWHLAKKVADGKLDIAALWGPFAGYANKQSGGRLQLQPANIMSNKVALEYSVGIGMRPGAAVLKYALDDALKSSAKQIKAILKDAGIPLVQCSECIVSGDLPAHGLYSESLFEPPQAQFLKPADAAQTKLDKAKARKQIEQALKHGDDATQQMFNAIVASQDQL
ncbi:MAG: transporter substrate-binding domain-containing protein, partial [Sinobacteraceae bacterium]|nr:transporter substrate-binding domain-containing protein [Nevskiaceae bacterium]